MKNGWCRSGYVARMATNGYGRRTGSTIDGIGAALHALAYVEVVSISSEVLLRA